MNNDHQPITKHSSYKCLACTHSEGKADASPHGAVEMYICMETVSFNRTLFVCGFHSNTDGFVSSLSYSIRIC